MPEAHSDGPTATLDEATPANLLRRWLKRARESSFAHYSSETFLNNLHLILGVPATIFAAVVGTAVFSSLANSVSIWLKITVGLFSIITAVLSGLQTFLRFSEKAERHRKTAVDYGAVRRLIEQHLVYTDHLTYEISNNIREHLDTIAAEAPNVSARIWARAQRKADDNYFLAKGQPILAAGTHAWAAAFPFDDTSRSGTTSGA